MDQPHLTVALRAVKHPLASNGLLKPVESPRYSLLAIPSTFASAHDTPPGDMNSTSIVHNSDCAPCTSSDTDADADKTIQQYQDNQPSR